MLSVNELKDIVPDPIKTIARLDEYIVGQEDAKKSLSVMLLNRALLKLNRAGILGLSVPIQKNNVLLIGSSGVGKTGLIRALGEIADIPITVFDITSVTSGAYIGNKVEDILVDHVNNCYNYVKSNYNRLADHNEQVLDITHGFQDMVNEAVETGIIYIDEIDKTRAIKGTEGQGDSVQNELLKIVEEGDISLKPARRSVNPNCAIQSVHTKDILFVGGGAFYGLPDMIKRRLTAKSGIGFGADMSWTKEEGKESEYLKYVTTKDLIDYGFKNEFLGRFPLKSVLKPLSKDTLIEIMKYSRNSVLIQYKELFGVFGIELVIEKPAFTAIADIAIEMDIGARSLKSIFSNILMEDFTNIFSHPGGKLVVTKGMVEKKGRGNESKR